MARDPVARSGGFANLRDAGAVRRPGVLFRADVPVAGEPEPAGVTWPPRTVVDLREPAERGRGPHPLDQPGTTVLALPLLAGLDPRVVAATDLPGLYRLALDRAAHWLPGLLEAAARPPGPLLVHCTAGKDRTGVAVAVLLRLAGVGREDVAADYARTGPRLDAVHRRLDLVAPDRPRAAPRHTVLEPAAIEAVLDRLDGSGVPHAWALAVGAGGDVLDAWRARLAATDPRA